MLLLTTTLLTAYTDDETNENYETIDKRQTKTNHRRNILTSRILLKQAEVREDANSPTTKENESGGRLLSEQKTGHRASDNYFEGNYTRAYERENINETPIDDKTKFNRSLDFTEIQTNASDITVDSVQLNLNVSGNETKRAHKIFGFGNNFGYVEEIHVFHKENSREDIVVEIIDENAVDDNGRVTRIYLEEEALDDAVQFGRNYVEELIHVKEPIWYNMGLFLDSNDPGSRVAAFGKPSNEMAIEVSRYGYLTLEASRKMAESFPENVSRQAAGFPGSFHPRQLQDACPLKGTPRCPPASKRYRTADGTCNNLENPWKGSAMLPMQRFLPPVYDDGIQAIRRSVLGHRLPSSREVSTAIHEDQNREIPTVTLMLMQWGQFIDHDVTSIVKSRSFNGSIPRCCDRGGRGTLPRELLHPSCLPIEVPSDDWFLSPFGVRCMEFIRSAPSTRVNCDLGWREQINQVTAYMDASTIYGSDIETSDSIRTFRNGKIIYGRSRHQGPLQPADPPGGELCRSGALTDDCFQTGDARVSEQPALTAMHTVWVRYHNKVATVLAKLNPHWSDEKIYQETRKIIYSLIQHITYREFLPIVLGPEVMELFELRLVRKGYYKQYNSNVNPAIANSFSTAAYRFGHSMVQNSFVRTDHKHRPLFNNVSLHDELNNFENIWSFGSVDRLLLGLINQPAQRRDEFICEELSNHLFQSPGAFFGSDLAAINIQRGRDHGIPPYTSWREPCGLSPIKTWADLKGVFNSQSVKRFQFVYDHVDDIDLFSGGLAEKPVRGGLVGPTFACIIAQQFLNLRKGDRFWYENGGFESSFTPSQLQQIRHITLSHVLCQTTDEIETIQPFVFLSADNTRNVRLPCNSPLIKSFDLSPWAEKRFDDFENSVDFQRKRASMRRVRRSKTKTKTTTVRPATTTKRQTKSKRKQPANTPLKVRITNVTTSSIKVENKYGGVSGATVSSIPPKPVYRPTNDDTDVTYLFGNINPTSTKPPENLPLEVNIKIQYFLPTTTTTRPTRKKKKTPTQTLTSSFTNMIHITQKPQIKPRPISYPIFLQSQGYDDVVVRPNDLFEKPTNKPRPTKLENTRPSYDTFDNSRPIQVYTPTFDDNYDTYGPTSNVYRPTYTDTYVYNDQTNKRPYTNPQNSHHQVVYEDVPFSASENVYYYNRYTTRRPSYRPQQNGYDDEIYDYVKRPTQGNYHKDDPINDVYATVFNEHDRVGDIPKKPSFGQTDYNGHTSSSDRIKKPTKIYSVAQVHKLDTSQIHDKLDFKTKLVRNRGYEHYDDKRFVKISSVRAGIILTDKEGDLYALQERNAEMDLKDSSESVDETGDRIRVVEIDVVPSEVEDDQWLIYNATEEIMLPLLPVPDFNQNVSCSNELPKPMKSPKIAQKLQVMNSRNL